MTDNSDSTDPDRAWWKEAVVYQVYPRSFNDSDGDGVGDLRGVVEKVPYLDDLGVDILWLSPVYDSPMHDNGYDIRDYRAIADEMGTMADWEDLRDALHERGMRLVMDLVVNHTSSQHEWFQKSRRRDEGYDEFYYWRDPDENGDPPNNWISLFGGSAWTYDDERDQYYLHLFDESQPDLNWRNPEVRERIYETIRWWMEKGVDGWRMDAISLISKEEGLPDTDLETDWFGAEFFNGPRIHEYIRELYDEALSDYDCVTIGETPGVTMEQAREYSRDGMDMLVHFDHMDVTYGPGGKWSIDHLDLDALAASDDPGDLLDEWDLRDLKEVMGKWQDGLESEGWNSLYLGSHDQARVVSRFGDDGEYHRESATLIATFLLTMRATPFVYQGDEIGMTNVEWESLEECRDVEAVGHARKLMDRYDCDFEDISSVVTHRSRDNARTPVQWSADETAGFTEGEPWIKVNDDADRINVEEARADSESVWHYYRELIELRGDEEVLVYGDYDLLFPDHEQIYAYTRTLADEDRADGRTTGERTDAERALVVLNWSEESARFELPDEVAVGDPRLLASNYDDTPADPTALDLRPYEATVYRLSSG
ncbi:glycoside hydrolase family 13 protein [Halorussus salinus]|uniref:glycoside hydrolase family 13 protein n=1 Tax=Halorussus salinus TaxID=1364935 RepID=UPI001EE4BF0F|nr:alpha-glucosidase [Halorussus salinus]